MQIRYFPGVRNNPKYEAAGMKLSDGETNTVDGHGAFKYNILLKAGGELDLDPRSDPFSSKVRTAAVVSI